MIKTFAGVSGLSRVALHDSAEEAVRFYESDAFLVDDLGARIVSAFDKGKRVIIIATSSRRVDIEKALAAEGLDLAQARMRNQYVDMDAALVLSKILVNAQPDAACLDLIVADLVMNTAPDCGGVWVFNEMVTLLWAQGRRDTALRLEAMWNELARKYAFFLYCAYPAQSLFRRTRQLHEVCAAHTRLTPGGNYWQSSSAHRLGTIEQLRQKILSHRRQRERRLLDYDSPASGRYWLGMDGRMLWANEAELGLLGYERDEYIGRHISEFHAEPAVAADILQRLRSNEILYDYPARRLCKNGSVSHTLMYSAGLWKSEKFIYVCCHTRMENKSLASQGE